MAPRQSRTRSHARSNTEKADSCAREAVSECRRSHHRDLIAIQLRFYLRNILGGVTVKKHVVRRRTGSP